MNTETTTSTKYVLEGKGESFGTRWTTICEPMSKEKALASNRFHLGMSNEYRLVEIVTTTTVTRRVME